MKAKLGERKDMLREKKRIAFAATALCIALAGCGAKEGSVASLAPETIQGNVAGTQGSSEAEIQGSGAGVQGSTVETQGSAVETQSNAGQTVQPAVDTGIGYAGIYIESLAGRASITLVKETSGVYSVEIMWPNSAAEMVLWRFHGSFDDNAVLTYHDCVRMTTIFDENGNGDTVTNYENGSGRLYFADGAMHWDDAQEHVANDSLFYKEDLSVGGQTAGAGSGDPNYYSGVTSLEKEIVEAFAENARDAYLEEDWEMVVDLINYPVTMYPNETIKNADEFLNYMKGKHVSASDMLQMKNETCRDMFYNGEGICMGSGQIWFADVNYMTDQAPHLRIIAVSGVSE